MTNLNERYFDNLINKVYKILPLFEEKNKGIADNINSLYKFEITGLKIAAPLLESLNEYTELNLTLLSLSHLISTSDISHKEVRREVFKCIGLVEKLRVRYLSIKEES